MDDETDVRFVDAHAEGDGRADDLDLVPQETLLVPRPLLRREPGVVRLRADVVGGKFFGEQLGGFAARAIDDAAVSRPGLEKREDLAVRFVLRDHAVGEVLAIEAADDDGRVGKVEMLDDVLAHPLGGRGGEGHDRDAREALAQSAKLPVLGPEIVAPLGDAMRLVNDDAADIPGAGAIEEAREQEPLWGGVEKLGLAGVEGAEARFGLGGAEGRIEKSGRNARHLERIHLVLHEGDQGGDDDGQPLLHDCGKLKAKRFPAAGRQQREDIAPGQRGADDLLLARLEGIEAEMLLEGGEEGHLRRRFLSSAIVRNFASPASAFARISPCHAGDSGFGLGDPFLGHADRFSSSFERLTRATLYRAFEPGKARM